MTQCKIRVNLGFREITVLHREPKKKKVKKSDAGKINDKKN